MPRFYWVLRVVLWRAIHFPKQSHNRLTLSEPFPLWCHNDWNLSEFEVIFTHIYSHLFELGVVETNVVKFNVRVREKHTDRLCSAVDIEIVKLEGGFGCHKKI